MNDFKFDDIFSPNAVNSNTSGLKRLSTGAVKSSINWSLLLEPTSNVLSSPEKKFPKTSANKALDAINEVSELTSPKKFLSGAIQRSADTLLSSGDQLDESRLGRIGHVSIMVNGKMYIHGGEGCNSKDGTLGDLLVYDIASATLSSTLCESPTRAWHSGTFLPNGSLLLVFGGERISTDDQSTIFIDEPLILDTSINLWYPPSISGKGPGARSGHTASLIMDNIVVFLGGRR